MNFIIEEIEEIKRGTCLLCMHRFVVKETMKGVVWFSSDSYIECENYIENYIK